MKYLLILFLLTSVAASAQTQPTPAPTKLNLDQLIPKEQQKEMGLDALSAEQKAKLEAWLMSFALRAAQAGATISQSSIPAVGTTTNLVETQIEGTFQGWSGDTIFIMTNGQIWQQAAYAYTYHYAYRPKVTIYKTNSGFKMQVEGLKDSLLVKRIK